MTFITLINLLIIDTILTPAHQETATLNQIIRAILIQFQSQVTDNLVFKFSSSLMIKVVEIHLVNQARSQPQEFDKFFVFRCKFNKSNAIVY